MADQRVGTGSDESFSHAGKNISKRSAPENLRHRENISEYTGYTADDPRLCSGIITLAAPFAVCLLGRHHSLRREMPVHIPIETMAENIKQLALANLENLKRNKR